MNHLIRGSEFLLRHPDFQLVGRDAELQRLTAILMRDRASSVLLVGAGGVGCTAICLGVQAQKNAPDAPFDLVSKRFFWLDVNGLFGDGEPGPAFKRIIDRLAAVNEAVLLVEDTRDLIEACRNAGTMHFINALVGGVRAGEFQSVFEARDDDLEFILKTSSDARELFTVLPIEEPVGAALDAIVRAAAIGIGRHHGVSIDEDAITAAIELTTKYHPADIGLSRAQPERSVTLIDRALAAYRLEAHRRPPPGVSEGVWNDQRAQLRALYEAQRAGETAVEGLEQELDVARHRSEEGGRLAGMASPEVEDILAKMRRFASEIVRNRAEHDALTEEVNSHLALTRDLVLGEFSDISGIPVNKLNENDVEKLRGLEPALALRIFGQEDVVRQLANGVKIARLGRRGAIPAAYLFLGPSGVGKTEIGKALAAYLFDQEAALARFDMSEYMEKHAVAKLIGAPPGYEGFEAGGILTNLMRRNGNRIILFDEIEKAHPDIFNIMLQVLGDGRLTDNVGRTVSFADAIILMTTNIGQPHFLDETLAWEEAEERARADLDAAYRSEFLNRFAGRQNIICFRRLDIDAIERIVRRELTALARVYGERGIRLEPDAEGLRAFCEARYDPRIGARGLPGFLQATLEPDIVNAILDNPDRNATARIRYAPEERRLRVDWQR